MKYLVSISFLMLICFLNLISQNSSTENLINQNAKILHVENLKSYELEKYINANYDSYTFKDGLHRYKILYKIIKNIDYDEIDILIINKYEFNNNDLKKLDLKIELKDSSTLEFISQLEYPIELPRDFFKNIIIRLKPNSNCILNFEFLAENGEGILKNRTLKLPIINDKKIDLFKTTGFLNLQLDLLTSTIYSDGSKSLSYANQISMDLAFISLSNFILGLNYTSNFYYNVPNHLKKIYNDLDEYDPTYNMSLSPGLLISYPTKNIIFISRFNRLIRPEYKSGYEYSSSIVFPLFKSKMMEKLFFDNKSNPNHTIALNLNFHSYFELGDYYPKYNISFGISYLGKIEKIHSLEYKDVDYRNINFKSEKNNSSDVTSYKDIQFENNNELINQNKLDIIDQNLISITGIVIDNQNNPLEANISWEDLSNQKILGKTKSSPKDGSYSLFLSPGINYGYYFEKEGFFTFSKNIDLRNLNKDTILEINDGKINLPSMSEMINNHLSINLNNLFFDFNSSELKEESISELKRLINLFENYKNLKVEVSGHTDNIGSVNFNMKLSQDRATSVIKYLNENGGKNITYIAKGYGMTKPVANNDTDEGRRMNRRVELKILNK